MNKRKVTTSKEILHNPDYEAISVTLDSEKIGKKVVPAGTVLAGVSVSVFKDRKQKVKTVTNEEVTTKEYVDGILLTDVDVTNGDATGACVYRGTINADKLADSSVAENYEDLEEVLPHIQFIKGGK
ncbi:TPA: head decoration protein [Streptococcus pyogenes]|uniref:structural protein n=1 Tax=Streptococcus pyogenes TaxID=1314 RepID=UPI000640A8B7|nr:structural protein [Streptococcus pyogenes]HER4515952.1 head decoration protein [Streptococcus pyogenes NGAS743]HER4524738.1 head decoration protein [Streptococcus pyogenes NGAS747]HER4528142.1 head decoration protein [Streptococcus pyogenes NGAS739]HER4574159.1 head decoration protein [Streptococcus pyogenes NGAS630]HER4582572.1 head decoration protein [Streptococcus pyogenes NGAS634]HER4589290.1 head decoration protein [Streptococcus pyogenes NGAS628]HER4591274.1 head decoration protein